MRKCTIQAIGLVFGLVLLVTTPTWAQSVKPTSEKGQPGQKLISEFLTDISENRVEAAMLRFSPERAWRASGLKDKSIKPRFTELFRRYSQGLITRTIIWPTLGHTVCRSETRKGIIHVEALAWRTANEIFLDFQVAGPTSSRFLDVYVSDLGISVSDYVGGALGRLLSGTPFSDVPELKVAEAAIAMLAGERVEPWITLHPLVDDERVAPQVKILLGLLALDRLQFEDSVRLFSEAGTVGGEFLAGMTEAIVLGNTRKGGGRLIALAEKHPEDPRIWGALGLIAVSDDNVRLGRAALEKAMQTAPGRGPYMYQYARLAFKAGQNQIAEQYAMKAIKSGVDPEEAVQTLALSQFKQGQWEKALNSIELYGKNMAIDIKALIRGQALIKLGQIDDAVKVYKEAVEAKPDNRDLLTFYARVQMDAKQYQGAADSLEKYLQAERNAPEAWFIYAEALARLEKNRQAMLYLTLAVKEDPTYIEKAKESEHLAEFRKTAMWKTIDR